MREIGEMAIPCTWDGAESDRNGQDYADLFSAIAVRWTCSVGIIGGRQRVHKIANVLDAVPSSLQPKVKAALHNIMNAEDKEAADLAIGHFQATDGAKYPKAVDKVLKDRE